jgi:hypothetical protein
MGESPPVDNEARGDGGDATLATGPVPPPTEKGSSPSPVEALADLEQDYPESESHVKKGEGASRGREMTTVKAICSDFERKGGRRRETSWQATRETNRCDSPKTAAATRGGLAGSRPPEHRVG